jgi:hypothetical protein
MVVCAVRRTTGRKTRVLQGSLLKVTGDHRRHTKSAQDKEAKQKRWWPEELT